jgi:hypothetical protein
MSLLHQDVPEKTDVVALGEAFTKGSSHIVWASVAATVLVTLLLAIYFLVDRKPPVVAAEVVQVWAHPLRTESSGIDANGAPMPKVSIDQVLVITRVKLRNRSPQPLQLRAILTNATLQDGIHSSYAAIVADYERIFQAYPELAALHGKALSSHAVIAPGETLEGDVVSAFRLTKQQWDARQNLSFTLAFQYQPDLVLTPPAAVTEQ